MDAMTTNLAPNGRPRVMVRLVGEDGNAFAILGRVRLAMREAGWSAEEISAYVMEATAGDYNHLLAVTLHYAEDATEPA